MSTDFRALCVELVRIADALDGKAPLISNQGQAMDGFSALAAFRAVAARARAALAEPESPAETLAVRPMMEQIAAMGDCIDQRTVGQIMAISQRAAAWLAENQPGQPVAVEPRGCPTPGACSCVIASARAALAEPEPEGPTDEEIIAFWSDHCAGDGDAGIIRLARWGTPNSAETRMSLGEPADGEVAELATAEMVRQLRTKAATEKANRCHYSSKLLTRAAELLSQRHPQPVPVSERLPGPELCWWYEPDEDDDGSGYGGSWTLLRIRGNTVSYSHWLPAHALPRPVEVEG